MHPLEQGREGGLTSASGLTYEMSRREAVATPSAPVAIGPYSQAIRSGNLVFVSGQIALDPATGELVGGGIQAETHRVLQNLAAILQAAGSSFDRVLKATVFLADLSDFAAVNDIYRGYFPDPAPARSTVQVAALPRGARVEIEVVARTP
jgi:2-iminobutanoate/2-iminopropanoate deaminase